MIVVSIAIRLFIVLSRRSDQRLYSHDRGDRRRSLSPRRRSTWPLAPACPWARSPPSVSTYVLSAVLAAAAEGVTSIPPPPSPFPHWRSSPSTSLPPSGSRLPVGSVA